MRNNPLIVALMFPALWIYGFLGGLDQFANTWFGGDKDQTISARAGQAWLERKFWAVMIAVPIIDTLFWIFEGWGHCQAAHEHDPDDRRNSVWKMHARWRRGEPTVV